MQLLFRFVAPRLQHIHHTRALLFWMNIINSLKSAVK